MRIEFDFYTAVGRRENNEDSFLCCDSNGCHLFAVSDGLGGHDNGELASEIAVNEIKEIFDLAPDAFDSICAIQSANTKI